LDLTTNFVNECTHAECQLPQINVTFDERKLCAILDTGAEISLISVSAVDHIKQVMPVHVTRERVCELVGFSGHRKVIDETVELSFSIGAFQMSKPHKFAVVDS
jgi:hypothetical protein